MKADNLNYLLKTSNDAKSYFKSLPVDTQLILKNHAGDVQTEEELHKCAEDIFHSSGMIM